MAVEIDCPLENATATVVVGTGATGIISASGLATSDVTQEVYQRVYGLAIPGTYNVGDPQVPASPPLGAAFVDNPGSGAAGQWFLAQVPGAVCAGTGAGLANTLIIWARFSSTGPVTTPSVRHFNGVCGAQTSCPRPVALPRLAAPGATSRPPIVALTTAPRAWRVAFDGPALKGVWSLELRDGEKGVYTWDNAGDGVETPLVRLRAESPSPSRWRLTLVLGDERICYTRPADAWQALGANVLELDPDETKCSFAPPATIRVTPG